MIIKSISPCRNDHSRVMVYFYDKSYITVDAFEAKRLGLCPNMEIDESLFPELSAKSRESGARISAANILGRRSMSKHELLKKLTDRGFSEAESNHAADWITELGALDDARYAAACAEYYRNRGFGARRIREELMKRGIARELIDEINEDEPESDGRLDAFLSAKLKSNIPDAAQKRKLINALIRRGFSYDDIRAALKRFEIETEDMNGDG